MNKVLTFSLVIEIIYEEFYCTFSLLAARKTKVGLKLGLAFKVGLPNKT